MTKKIYRGKRKFCSTMYYFMISAFLTKEKDGKEKFRCYTRAHHQHFFSKFLRDSYQESIGARAAQSHYILVPPWAISVEQNMRFGLVLGRLVVLKISDSTLLLRASMFSWAKKQQLF